MLGLFGQLKAKKGGVFLLDALQRSGVADQFHLLLAGWMEPDMEAWLAGHEIDHTVLPFLDRYELLPWYAACDWIAIPSFYDGLPNVLVEAAALGIPMVASRVDGMADVLSDGETAFLFAPGDEARCAWALQRAARRRRPSSTRGWRRPAGRSPRTTLDGDREIDAYVEVLTQTRPLAAVAHVILYYALGGGLGHLTRARKVLDALELDARPAHLVRLRARRARDRRAPRAARTASARPRPRGVPRVAADAARARGRADRRQLSRRHPRRALRVGAASGPPRRPPPGLAAVRPAPRRPAPPLRRHLPARARRPRAHERRPARAPAARTGRPLSRAPHTLVVHSGPDDEIAQLLRHAAGHTLVISPRHRDVYPIAPHLAHARHIVTAAGFNLMQETAHLRDRHTFIPFARPLDDQFARAATLNAQRSPIMSATQPSPAAALRAERERAVEPGEHERAVDARRPGDHAIREARGLRGVVEAHEHAEAARVDEVEVA